MLGCAPRVQRSPVGLLSSNQQEPALSGDGTKLALIVNRNGRPTVQLQEVKTGRIIQLRQLSRYQPHSSPSLSWNGRYLALIVQRRNRRMPIIEDRLMGRVHELLVPQERIPIRLSLSPTASQLAIQVAHKGKWRIEFFDMSDKLEPDQPISNRGSSIFENIN